MTTPRPESRLDEIESKMAIQDARIRELHDDTAEELRVIRQDIKQLSEGITASYVSIGDTFVATWKDTEATLATKEDLASLKATTGERFDKLEARFDKVEVRLDHQEELLLKILEKLP